MPSKGSNLLATVGSSWLVWSSYALSSGEVPTNGRPVQITTTFEGIAPALPLPQDNPNGALLSRSDLTEHSVPDVVPAVPKMSESFLSSPMGHQAVSMAKAAISSRPVVGFVAQSGADRHFSPSTLNPFNRPNLGIYSDEGLGFERGGAYLLPLLGEEQAPEAPPAPTTTSSLAVDTATISSNSPVNKHPAATLSAPSNDLDLTDFVRDIKKLDEEIRQTEQALISASLELAKAESSSTTSTSTMLENRVRNTRQNLLSLHSRRQAVQSTISQIQGIVAGL